MEQTIGIIKKDFLSGKWKGYYRYGKEYPLKFRKLKEPFEIEIKYDDDVFSGICIDNYTKDLFKAPAVIDGSFEGDRIYFIKRYPGLLTLDENDKPTIILNEPSYAIQYEGFLYKCFWGNDYYIKGEWSIDISYLDEGKNANYFSDTGTWKITKEK